MWYFHLSPSWYVVTLSFVFDILHPIKVTLLLGFFLRTAYRQNGLNILRSPVLTFLIFLTLLLNHLSTVSVSFFPMTTISDVCKFAHLQRFCNLHKKSVNSNAFCVLISRKMSVKSCYFSCKFRLKFTEILWHMQKSL